VQQVLALSFNAPDAITAVHIILAVSIVWLLCQGGITEILLAGILLSIALVTDGLAGFLTRRHGAIWAGNKLS
jgi:phosphatidylglycerophosphate synthase